MKPNTDAAFAREHGLKGTEMTLNTDLTDLSDVTDEAIGAVLEMEFLKGWASVEEVRSDPSGYPSAILLARCIQAHYPDMIVDPVTLKAREICAAESTHQEDFFASGHLDDTFSVRVAKAAIRAGMAMRGEG